MTRVRAIAAGELVDHARLRAAEAVVNGLPLRLEPLAVQPQRFAVRLDAAVRALDLAALRELVDEALA